MKTLSGWIDAHCHLADPRFEADLSEVMARALAAGIRGFVQGGVDPEDWERQRRLASQYPGQIISCIGLHPWWVASRSREEMLQALRTLEAEIGLPGAAQGVGELGLDFPRGARELQVVAFEFQLDLASRLGKPIVLHVVKSHAEALAILKKRGTPRSGGLVHSFWGSMEIARSYLDLGLALSFSGAIRKRSSQTMEELLRALPEGTWALETDSPDQGFELPPGRLNEPSRLIQVAETMARIRGESVESVLEKSSATVARVFSLNWK